MAYLDKESSKGIKIIVTGLDAAGKSSIILSILREFTKIATIKPTKGSERRIYEFLGMKVSEWDLGGQEKYRNEYFKEPDLFFTNTEIMIYVIDAQNPERIVDSLSYLAKIVDQFNKYNIEPSIYVFFHKIDPDIYQRAQNEINSIISNIKAQIEKKVNYKNFEFYITTIFDISTIFIAMSEIMLKKHPKAQILMDTIGEFAKKIKAIGLEIIDDNSFIIGSYYEDDTIKQLLNQTSPYFLKVNDTFEKINLQECQPEDQMIIQRFGKYFLFKKFALKKDGQQFYLLLCKNEYGFDDQEYNAFIKILKEIMYK